VVTFDQCSGNTGFHIIPDIGNRLPLHCTSPGKLFLSTLTKPEINSKLTAAGMPAFTPHTITDQSTLAEELSKIRIQGYALEDGEYKIGLRSVSAPVYDASGSIKYTLGVVGLFRRINSQEFEDIIANVISSSNQLSWALGHR
jgi:IclR family acetate operon transcriptional repressor